MSRWFTIDYRPINSWNAFRTEAHCHKIAGMWRVDADGFESVMHDNLWIAIGALMEHANAEAMRLIEIDRAGNAIV
jgi:hypothetical protein